jgi:hypothetical protein
MAKGALPVDFVKIDGGQKRINTLFQVTLQAYRYRKSHPHCQLSSEPPLQQGNSGCQNQHDGIRQSHDRGLDWLDRV